LQIEAWAIAPLETGYWLPVCQKISAQNSKIIFPPIPKFKFDQKRITFKK